MSTTEIDVGGIRRLAAAVLKRGINDCREHSADMDTIRKLFASEREETDQKKLEAIQRRLDSLCERAYETQDAAAWLLSDNADLFSAVWCCEITGQEIAAVRIIAGLS